MEDDEQKASAPQRDRPGAMAKLTNDILNVAVKTGNREPEFCTANLGHANNREKELLGSYPKLSLNINVGSAFHGSCLEMEKGSWKEPPTLGLLGLARLALWGG